MKILILNTFPAWGGDEKWTVNVGIGLVKRGHRVIIACRPQSPVADKSREAGLEVIPFNIGPDIAFWRIPAFRRHLKDNAIEVILCVQNRDVKIGALAAKLTGVPAIFARQGIDNIKKKFSHKIPFTKFIDGIITNTISIKGLYEGYGWFDDNFVRVVYDGFAFPDSLEEIDLHEEFDLKPDSKVIVGTGRLSRQKRFDLLIDVAKIAKSEKLNWSFVIVGIGRLENQLKKMASDHGVTDMVKFVGFREDVLNIMNSADMFVLSSDSEGMSNALREGMAVGKACVATDVFGVSELFQNGKSGIMVKRGDAPGIYLAIKKIFANVELKKSLGEKASKLINEVFTMDNMINEIEAIFEEKLAENKIG
jgi:glycosyltransferase involved in cell wall biosynthesis